MEDSPNRVTIAPHLGGQLPITPGPGTPLPCRHPPTVTHTLDVNHVVYEKDNSAHEEVHEEESPKSTYVHKRAGPLEGTHIQMHSQYLLT